MNKPILPILKGDLKTLMRISFPLMFFLFCEFLTTFCERIFLSYHAISSVHGSLNATYLATIFQSPCIAIGVMAQIFVGFYQGSNEYKRIGPCVWQLIWFSFLSSLITLPLSFWVSSWYFKDTILEKVGVEYFMILAFGNFLFPLNTALSSFYLGRGKTFFVTTMMLTSYALQLLLSWLLIFGIEGILPVLGARGAALAKCISMGIICCIFFCTFLIRKNREMYNTGFWQFSLSSLWHYMRPGLVRSFGYISSKIYWCIICYIMIKNGGRHLDVLTIGGTIITFLMFITTGIYKAILIIASNLIGAEKNREIWRLCLSFTIYTSAILVVLIIPLILFPDTLIYFFDSSSKGVFKRTFKDINLGIWLYVFTLTMQMSFSALLVILKEVKFQLYCYLFLFPISPIVVYFNIGMERWQADKLWFITACESLVGMFFFFFRFYQINWKTKEKTSFSPTGL